MEIRQAQSFLDENTRDRGRDRLLVCVRVVNENTSDLALPDGNVIGIGTWEAWVYEDRVIDVLNMVETDHASVAAAKRAAEIGIANEVRSGAQFQGTAEEVLALMRDKSNQLINETLAHVESVTPINWQAKFFEMTGRCVRPLKSAERVEGAETRVEPQIEREIRHQRSIEAAMSRKAKSKAKG